MPLLQFPTQPASSSRHHQPVFVPGAGDLRAEAEGLLRDLAFVLRATQTVRQAMTEEKVG